MNGFYGMGPKPIRVALAIPKRSLAEATNMISTAYSDMYESYYGDTSGNMANYGAYQVKWYFLITIVETTDPGFAWIS